jgi:hypothetical protein
LFSHSGESKSPAATPTQTNVKKSKNRINFSSATCGAKILASNSDAQSPGYLLTENKDQYMINACKSKKWSAFSIPVACLQSFLTL